MSSLEGESTPLAKRFNAGKPPLSYIMEFRQALIGISQVAEYGAEKYSRYNWKKGLKYTQVIDSLLRHLCAYADGEDLDPETCLPHVDHIGWNALSLAEMTRIHPELDDRECVLEAEWVEKRESYFKQTGGFKT